MILRQLTFEQRFVRSLPEVFEFFADEQNLERITPPWLNFRVLSKSTPKIQEGTLIHYSLKIRGLPVRWTTQITEWNPPHSFTDEQLRGPYRVWRHQHHFEEKNGQTVMQDRLEYGLPFGFLGDWVAGAWVARDVRKIFEFRQNAIGPLLGAGHNPV